MLNEIKIKDNRNTNKDSKKSPKYKSPFPDVVMVCYTKKSVNLQI